MHYKNVLTIFLLFFLHSNAFSTTFIVTSNADSGPGTFRDALARAAANGNAQKDYINFNLPDLSAGGRTIIVLSALPGISSNLVIDGSAQTGSPFGVSNAKVCLVFNSTGQGGFSALTIKNQSDVEIYGLYIRLINAFSPRLTQPIGIHILGTNNVKLGDVQKGNVISGFFFPFSENDDGISESMGLTVKSNFFSIRSDGLTVDNDYAPAISNVYGNVIIGGTPNEGNLLAEGIQISQTINTNLSHILIKNNSAGVNYNFTKAIPNAIVEVGAGNNPNPLLTNTIVNIEDNVICTDGNFGTNLFVTHLGGTVNIVRNYVGVDRNKNKLGSSFAGIYVQACKEVHIGDNNESDENYVGYCRPIFADNTGNLTFTKNSFFCTTDNSVYFDQIALQRTQCNTTKMTANLLSGTATPGALVDLYYTDMCKTCAAQTYFASVTADAAGNWVYNGALTGTVIVNATYNNASSEFTYPHINSKNVKVRGTCGGTGSVTGIQVFGAINIKWIDGQRNVVGNTLDLLNLKPGKYKLIVDNGGCADSTDYYQILPKFTLDVSNAIKKDPTCGNSKGSIMGLNIINDDKGQIDYSWTDANGKVWGTHLELQNVPAGSYVFLAKGKDTCNQTYGPVILQDQSQVVPPPTVNDIILCSPGETFLRVNNPLPGYTYNLYDSELISTPVAKSPDGRFQLTVDEDKTYYVSQLFYNCESTRTFVQVFAGLEKSAIPNAITPNSDGINDNWNIKGIEKYPSAIIQIFNRYGQKVLDTKGYPHPFDGTSNGSKLPSGVYFYIITLTPECHISGSLTILR